MSNTTGNDNEGPDLCVMRVPQHIWRWRVPPPPTHIQNVHCFSYVFKNTHATVGFRRHNYMSCAECLLVVLQILNGIIRFVHTTSLRAAFRD